jgi:uncharacterized protein (DUF1800 family)
MTIDACIAANRFGLGASPGQLAAIGGDPKAWLLGQLNQSQAALIARSDLASSAQAFRTFLEYTQTRRDEQRMAQSPMPQDMAQDRAEEMRARLDPAKVARAANLSARAMGQEVEARMIHALTTPAPFLERWTLFWSNALTMSAKNLQTTPFPGPYEREAIRPHVLAKFSELLKASALHAGMLIYLDQVRSVGPTAPAALTSARRPQRRDLGLNENLAREILELHTVGPDGGYRQSDVTEFARALTGWTVAGPRTRGMGARGMGARGMGTGGMGANQELGSVIFVPAMHEPGARTIMGKVFPAAGANQVRDILDWLARQPQTARRLATAIATHFVSDAPPASLISRLEQAFVRTDGDLAAVARTLVNSPEAWQPQAAKFKTPNDFLLSTLRASGTRSVSAQPLRSTFEQLGQAPWRAPSPKGWPDTADKWASPDAILKRVDWSNLAADVIGATTSPMAFAETALGASLTPATRTAISRAQDARQGIVLVLMSPEFQRR